MSDDKKEETDTTKAPTQPLPKLGKQYKGQQFVPILTPEDVKADNDLQAQYNHPDAIGIDAYCAIRGVRDPVMQAAMKAHTKVRKATKEVWDQLFKTF